MESKEEKVPTPEEIVQSFNDSAKDVELLTNNLVSLESQLIVAISNLKENGSLLDNIDGVDDKRENLLHKTEDFKREVERIIKRSQVVHLLIADAKMTATLMHEWVGLFKEMLPHIKFQQYFVNPMDKSTGQIFNHMRFGVGILLVLTGVWRVVCAGMFVKSFFKYLSIVGGLLELFMQIYGTIEKNKQLNDMEHNIDCSIFDVNEANKHLMKSEHDLTDFYAHVKTELLVAGFHDNHTLELPGAGPATINTVLAKSIKTLGRDKGTLIALINFAEDDLLALSADIALGPLSQEQIRDYGRDIKKMVLKCLKGPDYSEYDRKSAFVVLLTTQKTVTADLMSELIKAAGYEISQEEYLQMIMREMLDTQADPRTIKDKLKEHHFSDEDIAKIQRDIEAMRMVMQDELYKGVGDIKFDDAK